VRIPAVCLTVLLCALSAPAGASARGPAPIEGAVLDAAGPTSAFVHALPGRLQEALRAAEVAGLDPAQRYQEIDVFVAIGSADAFRALALSPAVGWIEANAPIHLFTDSSHAATRSEDLYRGAVAGTPYDGTGVGVAVVDTGVDGTIPALQAPLGRGDNFKILCPVPGAAIRLATVSFQGCPTQTVAVPMEDTDTIALGGHGTHVAGIIAGAATEISPASGEPFLVHGAAPGAAVYGIGAGAALSVDNAMDGLQWVLDNHDQVSPAIRVVNNSWGTSYEEYTDPDDPNQPSLATEDGYRLHRALWKMQDELVEAGVTVVFAAGNSGGGLGAAPTTTAQCINPTPGVICVANYNDLGSGSRAGVIDGTSSRGERSRPDTWPDLAAPGTGIISTCRATLPLCSAAGSQVDDEYFSLSGTSMAAPHVAGIVAQLLQADPTLTPAEVEDVLEDTAHKFLWGSPYGRYVDETNPDDESSFEKGHGLVDALSAVQRADSAGVGPAHPDPILLSSSQVIPGQAATSFFEPTVESNSSVTRAAFEEACDPTIPPVDGAVFEIPEELATGRNLITASGSNLFGLWDFNMWMYTSDCARNGSAMGGIFGDVSGKLPAETRYVVVTNHFFGLTTAGISVQPPPLHFTSDTATTGGFSDAATFGAFATGLDETPLAGQVLTFTLAGSEEVTWESTTDADGIARVSRVLELVPGDYTLRVEGSSGPVAGASIERGFTLLSESTVLRLVVEGQGVNRRATATLLDDDGAPVGGREVALWADDGVPVGRVSTDAAGVAVFQLPPQYRSPNHVFEATFCGDAYYSATATGAPHCP
jgi:serine protease AprX